MEKNTTQKSISTTPKVLVLGINPFEDVPGYQLYSMLRELSPGYVVGADESTAALEILSHTGAELFRVPKPLFGVDYYEELDSLIQKVRPDIVIAGTDAHLFALSQASYNNEHHSIYSGVSILNSGSIKNKWDLQEFISSFGNTPTKRKFETESDLVRWEQEFSYPVMVKGFRKDAFKAYDRNEALAAKNQIYKNPDNLGVDGGVYLEESIEGEEHSSLIVVGHSQKLLASLTIRKLATTKFGTTLAARVEGSEHPFSEVDLLKLSSQPFVMEIEWIKNSAGENYIFEVNMRFPSWIGALGEYGLSILDQFVRSHCCREEQSEPRIAPSGTLIYRLPQSGFLPLPEVFLPQQQGDNNGNSTDHKFVDTDKNDTTAAEKSSVITYSPDSLLWPGRSPHEFLIK